MLLQHLIMEIEAEYEVSILVENAGKIKKLADIYHYVEGMVFVTKMAVLSNVTMHVETVVMLFHKKPDSVINVKVEFGVGEGKMPLDNIAKRATAYKPNNLNIGIFGGMWYEQKIQYKQRNC